MRAVPLVASPLDREVPGLGEDDYAPQPCPPPKRLAELGLSTWGHATCTPLRASLATVGSLATIVALVALRPVVVDGADATGPFTARCGAGYYVLGHPSSAVRQACMGAFEGRGTTLFVAGGIAIVALGALALAAAPIGGRVERVRRWLGHLTATGPRVGLLVFAVVAIGVGGIALRTVPIHSADADGPLTVHCGLSYYVGRTDNPVVDAECGDAFETRAAVATGAGLGAAAAVLALAGLVLASRRTVRDDRPPTLAPTGAAP